MRLAQTLLPKGGAEGEAGPSNTGKVAVAIDEVLPGVQSPN
jgi:hypothetical protein